VEIWEEFEHEWRERTDWLTREAGEAWRSLQTLALQVEDIFLHMEAPAGAEPRVSYLERLTDEFASRLLFAPLETYRRESPHLRFANAIAEFDAGMEECITRLSMSFPTVRERISSALLIESERRLRMEAPLHLSFSQGSLDLVAAWQIYRRHYLAAISGAGFSVTSMQAERQRWVHDRERRDTAAARQLASLREWRESALSRLASSWERAAGQMAAARTSKLFAARRRAVDRWSRRQSAVEAALDLEQRLAVAAARVTAVTVSCLEDLDSEGRALSAELDHAISWLDAAPRIGEHEPFPAPEAALVSAEERLSEWSHRVTDVFRAELPAGVEVADPSALRFRWRRPYRRLEPLRVALHSLHEMAHAPARDGLRQAELAHGVIVREIERAREVVAFGQESARTEPGEARRILEQTRTNARNLLGYQKSVMTDPMPIAEQDLVRAQAAAFLDLHVRLEESQLGILAHALRRGGSDAASRLPSAGMALARRAARETSVRARRATDWTLYKLGWVAPPSPRVAAVVERERLSRVLEVRLGERNLPLLYRRLFRLAPVEDPRFLVGRESEMKGLAAAAAEWERGHGAAVLVIGERGSGKTSFLNCAASALFGKAPLVRGQFSHRIVGAGELHGFLGSLVEAPQNAALASFLSAEKRIVVLEELERTFLRAPDGFEALGDFLRLVETTCFTTLWILSINATAFRYLDRVLGLGRSFTHRINAMAVTQEQIMNALLQRHNLSGLRLEFAPLPPGDPRVSRVRALLGVEPDPKEAFFRALYSHSRGIFRAALELWQGSIDRVESGVVRMAQPLDPDYQPLAKELNQDDAFAIQAVLQHGGLTEPELAHVLCLGAQECRRRIARLMSLELLEPEPSFPGFRVRPEAGRFVREVLHARNLL